MTPLEWVALTLFLVLWYAAYFSGVSTESARPTPAQLDYRAQYGAALAALPVPPFVYALVWTLVYGLNAGAVFVYWRDGDSSSARYDAVLALVLVNVALNKSWTPLFFGVRAPRWALVDLAALLVLTVVILVLFALDALWLAVGLFVPYTLWLVVALYLNWRFIAELQAIRRRGRGGPAGSAAAAAAAPPPARSSVRPLLGPGASSAPTTAARQHRVYFPENMA